MSNIEWTDATWNPVIGCTPVSPGCLNCYAATMAHRMQHMPQVPEYHPRVIEAERQTMPDAFGVRTIPAKTIRIAEVRNGRAVFTGDVRTMPDRLGEPLKWRKPRRVFVCSMSDLFHASVPFEFVDRVFAVMALCPQHTFQVLTKRPERMAEYLNTPDRFDRFVYERALDMAPGNISDRADYCEEHVQTWPLPNVWIGTSVENQDVADVRIPDLLECPAAVRFLSVEPLLGAVDLHDAFYELRRDATDEYQSVPRSDRVDWIIVGGESGAHARPCNVEWIRGVVQQAKAVGVACFVKQLGAKPFTAPNIIGKVYTMTTGDDFDTHVISDPKGGDPSEWPEDLRVREWPEVRR